VRRIREREKGKAKKWRDLAHQNSFHFGAADPLKNEAKMHYVYILLNDAKTRTYTGVSDDVEKRLAEHNDGRVPSSRPYRPYEIIHVEQFETLKEARQKEKFYKSTTGRRRLKSLLFKD